MPTMSPSAPTTSPLSGAPPLSTATMEMPSIPIMKNSGALKASTMGRSTGMETARIRAPKRPPIMDDM